MKIEWMFGFQPSELAPNSSEIIFKLNRNYPDGKSKKPDFTGFSFAYFLFNQVIKAVDGFEPTIKLLQSRALPLGYTAITETILPKKMPYVKWKSLSKVKKFGMIIELL